MTREQIIALEYFAPTYMHQTGEWVALQKMIFTVGMFVGLDYAGYRTRFCYPDERSARDALIDWNGKGDPPGPWIKEKGAPGGDRENPNTFKGIPITEDKL